MTLRRTGEARGAAFYVGDDGKKYQLRQVDRNYDGRKKPPKYFLEVIEGERARYLSGLFPTGKAGLYSLDLRDDETGVRLMFDAAFSMGGAIIELKPKRQRAAAR